MARPRKLTDAQVTELRALLAERRRILQDPLPKIAARYRVSHQTLRRLERYEVYKGV